MQFEFRTARSFSDYVGAFRLLHNRYVQNGLAEPSDSGLRILDYQLQPESQLFVALHRNQVVGTVTLVPDHPRGLPLEASFTNLRTRSSTIPRTARLAEVCALTVCSEVCREETIGLYISLTSLLTHFARRAGVTQLVATVHPRHARFYQRAMGFRVLDELETYSLVKGNPAAAVTGSIVDPEQFREHLRAAYFTETPSLDLLQRRPIMPAIADYFGRLMRSENVKHA